MQHTSSKQPASGRKVTPVTVKARKPTQRPALFVDTPEQKALKAITARTLEKLKAPHVVPSEIILAALKEARAL